MVSFLIFYTNQRSWYITCYEIPKFLYLTIWFGCHFIEDPRLRGCFQNIYRKGYAPHHSTSIFMLKITLSRPNMSRTKINHWFYIFEACLMKILVNITLLGYDTDNPKIMVYDILNPQSYYRRMVPCIIPKDYYMYI